MVDQNVMPQLNQSLSQNIDPQSRAAAAETLAAIPDRARLVQEQLVQGAFDRAQKAAMNLQAIQESRANIEHQQGQLEIDKKKAQIMMDEAEHNGQMSEMQRKMLEQQFGIETKQKEDLLKAQRTISDHAHDQYGNDLKMSVGFLSALSQGMGDAQGGFSTRPGAMVMDEIPRNVMTGQPVQQPSIPMQGTVPAQEEIPPRYEFDMTAQPSRGVLPMRESPEYTAYQKAKDKTSFSVNALKINDDDKNVLEQVYRMRASGQPIDRAEILSSLSPETAVSVQGLIDYTDDPKMYSSRNNARVEAVRLARMVDPTYDPTKYEERKKYRMELASESSFVGKQKISLNTVAQHIDQLNGYIDALGGGNFTPENMVINFAKTITGDPSITKYEQASEAVTSEMQRLLTGVGVTQAGMAEARKIVDKNTGYRAKKEALQSLVRIVEGRISPLRQSFKTKMGRDERGEIVFPETQAVFDKYLIKKDNNIAPKSTSKGTKYRVISE